MPDSKQKQDSGRSRLEAELEASKNEYRLLQTITQSTEGGIYIVQDFKIVYNNPSFCNLCGYSSKELHSIHFIDLVHYKDKKLIKLLFSNNFQEIRQKQSNSFTFRIQTKSGEPKWLKSHVSLINWEDKPALLDSCYDITAQKNTESKLVEEEQNFKLLKVVGE